MVREVNRVYNAHYLRIVAVLADDLRRVAPFGEQGSDFNTDVEQTVDDSRRFLGAFVRTGDYFFDSERFENGAYLYRLLAAFLRKCSFSALLDVLFIEERLAVADEIKAPRAQIYQKGKHNDGGGYNTERPHRIYVRVHDGFSIADYARLACMSIFARMSGLIAAWWKTLLIGGVVVIGAAYFTLGGGEQVGTALTIARGDYPIEVSVSGSVKAASDADLGFAANGRIARTYVRVGDRIYAGAVLAEMENGDLYAQVAQRRAALAQAQARLDLLRAGTRPEEVAVASASVESAVSALMETIRSARSDSDDAIHNKADTIFINPRSLAEIQFLVPNAMLKMKVEQERRALEPALSAWATSVAGLSTANAEQKGVEAEQMLTRLSAFLADANSMVNQAVPDPVVATASTLSTYASSLATARSNVNAAATALADDRTALASAKRNLELKQAGSTKEDIAAQEAAVVAAEADVRSAQAALAKTLVVAPFTGVVTRMDVAVGEIVSPGTSEIALQSAGVYQIETYIPEVSIAGVALGNEASTTLDAYGPKLFFPARVVAIDPAETVRDGVSTYKTTLAFTNPDPRIRSGMTANVTIRTGTLEDAIVIPAGAVRTREGSSFVSVRAGEEYIERQVEVSTTPALGVVQVLSGLSEGDVILATPAL